MVRTFPLTSALLTLALIASPAYGEVYKWVDENGVTHYTQQPPPGRKEKVIKPQVDSAEAQSTDSSGTDKSQGQEQSSDEGGKTQSLEAFCKKLRERKKMLRSEGQVKVKTSENTVKTLSSKERQKRLERVNQQLKKQCSDN